METFEYKDHADDALSVAALDGDCDGCSTGAAIVGMGSTTVHLDPLSQLALAKWLLANLREHGESTPGLEPPAAPLALGYSLMLNVGDAELSLSDSVSLTGPAMSMLTTAAAEAMQRFREITEPDETDADGVLALAREVLADQGRRLNECRREHGNIVSILRASSVGVTPARTVEQGVTELASMAEWFRDVRNVLFKAGISVPSSETADAVRSLVEEMRRVAAVRAPKLDEMNEQQFRAAVEAAVRRLVEGDGEGMTAPSAIVEDIIGAGNDYASERYSEGHTQGMYDEREVHPV